MAFDFTTLELLRHGHPAWKLLRSDHAALVASFLHAAFVAPNVRGVAQADLCEKLEDHLYDLRLRHPDTFGRPPLDYLNDWAQPDKGWLRKFYRQGSDEPQFDLTPAAEKAIGWLTTLTERSFVGTESRLLTLFALLRQMSEGSETDPEARLADLQRRRDDIDAEMARIHRGDLPLLDDTGVRDRFQQFMQLARELLADFREVEHNFRTLDRKVRERIALWTGHKGALLQEIMGERDAIADSDQGRSFRAFWEFLMSSQRQEELSGLLERVLGLAAVAELGPDPRMRRVHYDWLEAGEHTQRTVADLSRQLRRFLDDKAWLENRRIMDLLHGIEAKALDLRSTPPVGAVMTMAETSAELELPMERPLYTPAVKVVLADSAPQTGEGAVDLGALYDQVVVDQARLRRHIRQALQSRTQVTLRELAELQPLEHGLAELVAYLQLAEDSFDAVVDESVTETIRWKGAVDEGEDGDVTRQASLPRVIFVRAK